MAQVAVCSVIHAKHTGWAYSLYLSQENYSTWKTNMFFKCNPISFFTAHYNLCKILTTVLWGTRSSFEARHVDLPGMVWKASRTASTVSTLTLGLPLLLRLPTLPVSTNFEYHALMLLTSGGGRPYSFLNFRCTETGYLVSRYHKTHWAWKNCM